ncbi:MXAN_5187 C-terminal domain-containing protein [Geopsychrobacter electrodiphilus]|uniref:MXAN_5187 C-terminal domain-containing protein n=1 Tax=Geopsychrobacter electrodiphilus TaxID=225196 RepID=UPI00035F7DE8|nr:MXAN_5187 C-terminal domain-containing protein [Geopsychrobacter electrodiphilus]
MKERRKIEKVLNEIQQEMKELEIRYEQYFAGVEKREPQRNRTELAKRIRQLATRPIFQTDIKFRYQSLASRFYSYSQYWDRILRLMDEGKYHRHLSRKPTLPKLPAGPAVPSAEPQKPSTEETDRLLEALLSARQKCGQQGAALTREKVEQFLTTQKQKVQEKFGDRPVEFIVDSSSGKPQVKARLIKG